MAEIGIITEQGDLGLGFDNLNAKDQQAYNEATKGTSTEGTTVVTENK